MSVAQGVTVFQKYCKGCHNKGGNSFNPKKKLTLTDLKANKVSTAAAIAAKVKTGAGMMPSYGLKNSVPKLTQVQINNVAAYVLDQANKGWK